MNKGFYEHLREVPNPHPEGKVKGTLEEFDHNARLIAEEALRRTGVDSVEEDVRNIDLHPETKLNLGRNYITPRGKDDERKGENHE